jgi:hypothetical protein
MLRAAIVGIGTWGQNLVRSVEGSERIRFVAGATWRCRRLLDRTRFVESSRTF